MKAAKGNREYIIEERQKKSYQDNGFDIYEDNGTQVGYGRGKTVPYGDYAALKKENESLKAAVETLKETNEKTEMAADSPEEETVTGKKSPRKTSD